MNEQSWVFNRQKKNQRGVEMNKVVKTESSPTLVDKSLDKRLKRPTDVFKTIRKKQGNSNLSDDLKNVISRKLKPIVKGVKMKEH